MLLNMQCTNKMIMTQLFIICNLYVNHSENKIKTVKGGGGGGMVQAYHVGKTILS